MPKTTNASSTDQPMRSKKFLILFILLPIFLAACTTADNLNVPGVSLTVDPAGEPKEVATGVQLLVLLTVLTIAPSILLMMTSFTRIIIVLSMVRSAIGAPTIPPNQVIIGLSLILTFFIMTPVFTQINDTALQPYLNQEIDQKTALEKAFLPIREFMFKQVREKDLELFLQISKNPKPQTLEDIPNSVLLPAFMISELRTAFTMAFVIYIPFLIIDMVISSILLSMGMMMLPPSLISMPFKILLFVMVDGWYLLIKSLTVSFY